MERKRLEPTRLALRVPDESAAAIGVRRDWFLKYVKDDLRLVRRGKLVLCRVGELERWLRENERPMLDAEDVGG